MCRCTHTACLHLKAARIAKGNSALQHTLKYCSRALYLGKLFTEHQREHAVEVLFKQKHTGSTPIRPGSPMRWQFCDDKVQAPTWCSPIAYRHSAVHSGLNFVIGPLRPDHGGNVLAEGTGASGSSSQELLQSDRLDGRNTMLSVEIADLACSRSCSFWLLRQIT